MPQWAWIATALLSVIIVLLISLVAILAYRAAERRSLLQLISRREAVTAAGQALEELVDRLQQADDEARRTFADDPDSLERQVLEETASRARLLTDDLDTMPMPQRLVRVADALADASFVVADEAAKVAPDARGDEVLAELGSIDLDRVHAVFAAARRQLQVACDVCRVNDELVYGGGLYL